MIREMLYKISSEFTSALNEPYVGHPLANYIRVAAPKILKNNIPKKFSFYNSKGGCGQDKWAHIRGAWVGIFMPEVTTGMSKGYYLVYGFPAGTTEIIFGLSQGYDEAEKDYKANWEKALEQSANLMRLKVNQKYSDGFSTKQPVFKFIENSKDKGYRVGYSHHKIYDGTALPSEVQLHEDLVKMLNAYEEIYVNGGRNLDSKVQKSRKNKNKYEDNEEGYQAPLSKRKKKKPPRSLELTNRERNQTRNRSADTRPRDPSIAEDAKENANYQCEVSSSHVTFKRGIDNKQYTEAHHLIPYTEYDKYADQNICLDRKQNIVSLCPNCHRNIHHGTKDEIYKLLEVLFKSRGLAIQRGYGCDLNKLKNYYLK